MIDRELLSQIVAATKAGAFVYTSKLAYQPLLANVPALVEVNDAMPDPSDATKFATRATADGVAFAETPEPASAPANGAAVAAVSNYPILKNVVLPEAKKRGNISGGQGAPTKYPFAQLEVGDTFFSPNSDHKNKDAHKSLGSTVSAQNDKYSEPTGEMKSVTRAVRDPETKKAKLGPDGKKITETVQLPVKKYARKFTIRQVTGGKNYGEWTAPSDGALIARIL